MRLSENFYSSLNLCLNTRCNICRNSCPKFLKEKAEFNSPRGKLELIFEAIEGNIAKEEVVSELLCVEECDSCLSSCPHEIVIPLIFKEFVESCRKKA